MIRLIAFVAFALALATSAQAMSPVPLHQPDGMITQVREACGAGRAELMVSAWPEPPSVKSAGARYGVQGTSAVSGIDTPEPISGIRRGRPSGRPYLIWRPSTSPCLATSRDPGPTLEQEKGCGGNLKPCRLDDCAW